MSGRWWWNTTWPLSSLSQRVAVAGRAYRPVRYGGDVLLVLPCSTVGDEGWGVFAAGDLNVIRVAGDHVAMVRAPHAAPLGAAIARALDAHSIAGGSAVRRQAASAATG